MYWSDTAGVARYSIPSYNDHHYASSSVAKSLFRQTYQNSTDADRESSKLLELFDDNESLSSNMIHLYDGLGSLDENRLDEMIETDLVSSSNV